MKKEKIIIVEGPQGAGKTTITDYLRNTLPYTNLYRLSGISDSTKAGLEKVNKYYETLNLAYFISALPSLFSLFSNSASSSKYKLK